MTVNNIQNGINDIIISNSIINASYIINLNNSFFLGNIDTVFLKVLKF